MTNYDTAISKLHGDDTRPREALVYAILHLAEVVQEQGEMIRKSIEDGRVGTGEVRDVMWRKNDA